MPTWNENELEECWNNLYRESGKFTLKSVKDKFKLCGGIARWIFSYDQSLSDIDSVIKRALTSVEPNMLCNQAKDFSGDEYAHKLIHINTNLKRTDEAEPYTESFCLFASDNVANRCLKKFKENYKECLRSFIESARNIPEMGSLRGQLFELVSHEILRQGGVFTVRKLTGDGKLGPETTITLESLEEISFDNVSDIKENIGQNQKIYYRPTSKIFETIDSYVHHNKLFQVTVAKSHGIKQEGLRAIKGILDFSCRINFYFVLPKDVFITFTKEQKYQNTGKGIIIDEWITEDIDQYALCIDLAQYSF
ncbi:hypothetical protein C1646_169467 [Rhizophagus diaphanus]|nr:hypothetical protein C1646_169467 [Rhizophagus diaphanus] [Rhizophagus sp. MUCL 43196]